MAEKRYFSSESVTEGHPDKVCDKISDSVLDAIFAQDPMARVACETCATTDFVMVMGEITTTAKIASSTESEILSQTLSGCPSVTDSLEKYLFSAMILLLVFFHTSVLFIFNLSKKLSFVLPEREFILSIKHSSIGN